MSFFSTPPINLARRGQGALTARIGADVPVAVQCPSPGYGALTVLGYAALVGAVGYWWGKGKGHEKGYDKASDDYVTKINERATLARKAEIQAYADGMENAQRRAINDREQAIENAIEEQGAYLQVLHQLPDHGNKLLNQDRAVGALNRSDLLAGRYRVGT